MIPYSTISDPRTARDFGLIIQSKAGWRSGILNKEMRFVHATNTPPEKVKAFGLSPEHASEYLLGDDGKQLGEGKMVFAMPEGSSGKIVSILWGKLSHRYTFKAPVGTKYYSQNGVIFENKEIAFPYIIEASDIEKGL